MIIYCDRQSLNITMELEFCYKCDRLCVTCNVVKLPNDINIMFPFLSLDLLIFIGLPNTSNLIVL